MQVHDNGRYYIPGTPEYLFSFFVLRFCFFSFNLSGLQACVCCACLFQYDGMAEHRLPPLQHYDAAFLCRSFVTSELVSL